MMTLIDAIELSFDIEDTITDVECNIRRTVRRKKDSEGWSHVGNKWVDDFRFWAGHIYQVTEDAPGGVLVMLNSGKTITVPRRIADLKIWCVTLRRK